MTPEARAPGEDVEGLARRLDALFRNAIPPMAHGAPLVGPIDARILRDAAATLRELSRKLEGTNAARDFWERQYKELPVIEQLEAAETALEEAKAEAERVRMLPELEWAEVTAAIMQEVARVARAGYQPNAKAMQDAMDAGKTYVVRLRAALEEARRERGVPASQYNIVSEAHADALIRVKVLEAALREIRDTTADEGSPSHDVARRALSPQPQEPATEGEEGT